MGDFKFATDFGRWLNSTFYRADNGYVLAMSLDLINYQQINITGWPLQFGLSFFFAANDLSARSTLDKSIFIEFDIRILEDVIRPTLYSSGYSGHRVMVGTKAIWDETSPRTNKTHFLEIDLVQTDGYSSSYGDPKRPQCRDAMYDRCFYSTDGKYAEGREISYQTNLQNKIIPTNSSQWIHAKIPLSDIIKRLGWVSPPNSWASAKLSGLILVLNWKERPSRRSR